MKCRNSPRKCNDVLNMRKLMPNSSAVLTAKHHTSNLSIKHHLTQRKPVKPLCAALGVKYSITLYATLLIASSL